MEGLIERLQNPQDAEIATLLAEAEFYLVPNMNPDGAYRGHLRTNHAGQDLNRAWQSASSERSPEVLFVLQHMQRIGVDLFLDIHGDEEILTCSPPVARAIRGTPHGWLRWRKTSAVVWLVSAPSFRPVSVIRGTSRVKPT